MVDISEGGRANTRHIEEKLLVIPHGIYVVGMVQSANKLRVEGEILTPLVTASQLVVTPGGAFKGVIEVEEADIGGTMDGTILVSGRLIVRSTGTILGAARYSILHVEDGARIVGKLERISQDSANLPSRLASAAAVMPPPMACVDAVESRLV